MREIVICTACKGENCRVEELYQTEKITMEEYARRHRFPRDVFRQAYDCDRTARRMLITCQDCGEQHEFTERIEPLPQVFLAEEAPPEQFLSVRGIGIEERFKVGCINAPITTETDNDQR